MRSILEYIKISFVQSLQYRAELLVWILLSVVNLVVLLLVWTGSLQPSSTVGGLTVGAIVQYYFIVTLIDTTSAAHFETWRAQEVVEGKVDTYLTKPISYPFQVLYQDLGGKLFWLALSLPLLAGTYLLMASYLPGSLPQIHWPSLPVFILLLGFGYLVEFCLAMMTVLATFWFEGAEGLQHFKWVVLSLFSGMIIPLSLMPAWLQQLVNLLPFKYLYAVPIGVIQGSQTLSGNDLLVIIASGLSLLVATTTVWNWAQKHYASAGG